MVDKTAYSDFLMSRRSIRKFLSRDVPLEVIDGILNIARWAPSAHNAQPWRFYVLQKKAIKEKLAMEMAKRLLQDRIGDGCSVQSADDEAAGSFERFSRPPILIVACADMSKMTRYPDKARQKAEEVMATQSLAAAIQNILLGVTAYGLGACWFCAPLFCPDLVKEIIGIPHHCIPQGLITVGYPDEDPEPPTRLQLHEIRNIV